jgi:AraC-like DNA-binding protein
VSLAPNDFWRTELAGFVAIVLLRRAIDDLDPGRAVARLASTRAQVVLCAHSCRPFALAAWVRLGFEFVVPEVLPERLHRISRRPRLDPSRWLGVAPARGSLAYAAAAAVNQVARLSVGDWAALTGRSPSGLERFCRTEFGETPKGCLQRYLLAAYDEIRASGVSAHQAAAALGYSEAAALHHALDRARRRRRGRSDANSQRR